LNRRSRTIRTIRPKECTVAAVDIVGDIRAEAEVIAENSEALSLSGHVRTLDDVRPKTVSCRRVKSKGLGLDNNLNETMKDRN
jgi:hypothetical protein